MLFDWFKRLFGKKDAGPLHSERTAADYSTVTTADLMRICENRWAGRYDWEGLIPPGASPEGLPGSIEAQNELGKRTKEVLQWAVENLRHQNYDAREACAWLVGEAAKRGEISDDQLGSVIETLSALALRSWKDDPKETQANAAAILALGETNDRRVIPTLAAIVTSPEWDNDDNSWDAACMLGKLVGEPFEESEDPKGTARKWLKRQ